MKTDNQQVYDDLLLLESLSLKINGITVAGDVSASSMSPADSSSSGE